MLSMAIPDRAGWRVIHGHQQESPNTTAALLNKLADDRLARAFALTSADIEDRGHPVATLAEWLIKRSIAQDDSQEKEEPISLTRQERLMSVPYPLGVEFIFEIAKYTTERGIGYYVFGYRKTPGIPLENNRFMIERVGKMEDKWIDEDVNTRGSAGSEFPWVARIMRATSFQWFRVRVHEGDNLDPQGGYPMAFRRAA